MQTFVEREGHIDVVELEIELVQEHTLSVAQLCHLSDKPLSLSKVIGRDHSLTISKE